MRAFDSWTAFLVTLFAVVGLCGLFASYAGSIPLERGNVRMATLDKALATRSDGLEALRPALGDLASLVLSGAGALPDRVAAARVVVADEAAREAASIGYRTRLMLGVVTLISAALGSMILAAARRQAFRAGSSLD